MNHFLIAAGVALRATVLSFSALAADGDRVGGRHIIDACAACYSMGSFRVSAYKESEVQVQPCSVGLLCVAVVSQFRKQRQGEVNAMDMWDFLKWRKTLRYTQAEAAEMLGVNRGTIQNWER